MRGCLASLGNDGILELFALNTKIVEICVQPMGLRQVSRTNSNVATEIWSPRCKIQHPKPSVKFLVTLGGSAGDPFMPSKPHVLNFPPLGFMGLAHESCFKHS